jgi:hypothetical protein
MIKPIILLLLILLLTTPVIAETIHLKNGKVLQGTILTEDDSFVTINTSGVTTKILRSQIQDVQNNRTALSGQRPTDSLIRKAESRGFQLWEGNVSYHHAGLNFNLDLPKSCFLKEEKEKLQILLVSKTSADNIVPGSLSVSIFKDMGPQAIDHPITIAAILAATKSITPQFKLISRDFTEIDGNKALHIVYTHFIGGKPSMSSDYYFKTGTRFFYLSIGFLEREYDEYFPEADGVLRTFKAGS